MRQVDLGYLVENNRRDVVQIAGSLVSANLSTLFGVLDSCLAHSIHHSVMEENQWKI